MDMRLVCRLGADYLSELLYTPEQVIRDAEQHLARVQFDSIAGTGLSGALAVPLLARHFGVPFALVRKPNDLGAHSTSGVEGMVGSRWLMADDRIATGAACGWVREQLGQIRLPDSTTPQFVGLYVTKGNGAFWEPERIPGVTPTTAASGYVCPLDDAAESFVVGVVVAPDMYRRIMLACSLWLAWSVPSSVKYRSAVNCASMRFNQDEFVGV